MSRVARHTMKAAAFRLVRYDTDKLYSYAISTGQHGRSTIRNGVVYVPGKHSA